MGIHRFVSPKKLNTSLNFQTLKLDFYIGRDGALLNKKNARITMSLEIAEWIGSRDKFKLKIKFKNFQKCKNYTCIFLNHLYGYS